MVEHAGADDAPTDDDDLGVLTSRSTLVDLVGERVSDVQEVEASESAIARVERADAVLAHERRQMQVGHGIAAGAGPHGRAVPPPEVAPFAEVP